MSSAESVGSAATIKKVAYMHTIGDIYMLKFEFSKVVYMVLQNYL
jgi:hypothetical protein